LDEGFLWESVSGSGNGGRALRRKIVKGMGRFAAADDIRGAVLGEGGEYETLAIDGPGFLWKSRIEIEEREIGTGEGGVAFMKLRGAKCVPKPGDELTPQDVRRPALLDAKFAAALEDVPELSISDSDTRTLTPSPAWSICEPHHRHSKSTWTISNLVAPEAGPGAGEQMDGIVKKAEAALKTISDPTTRSTEDIVFATVLLRSMDDFALMNNVYISLFKKPNPPARVTVACGDALPSNVKVMISFIVDMGARSNRQGLHVQSRSYWAPANIGPYSQAISIPLQGSRVVYIAGQIPLEPASMDVATAGKSWLEDYCLRAVLSLQHLWRIGEAMQVDWWLGGVAFLTGAKNIETQAKIAWHLWKRMHARVESADSDDEGPQLDAWDIKYGRRAEELMPESVSSTLPKFSVLSEDAPTVSPFLAVEVNELPRGSDIEWQGLGSQCTRAAVESKTDCVSATVDNNYRYNCLEVASQESFEQSLREIMSTNCQNKDLVQAVLYTTQPVAEGLWVGQVVPCSSVWGREGRRLVAGIVLQEELIRDR
jgi:diphthine-ammonia ligase